MGQAFSGPFLQLYREHLVSGSSFWQHKQNVDSPEPWYRWFLLGVTGRGTQCLQVWPLDSDPRFTQRSDAKALSMHTHPQQVPSSITYVARPEP